MTDNDILKILESRKSGLDEMAEKMQYVINSIDIGRRTRARLLKYQLAEMEYRISEVGLLIRIITEEKRRLCDLATIKMNSETEEN